MKPWPLETLLQANRNAVTVYVVLKYLAGDKMITQPTREKIKAECHLSHKVISSAIGALAGAGWIKLTYGRDGYKRWYRIVLSRSGFLPIGRKTTRRKKTLRSKNDPKGKFPYRSKMTPSSSKEEGGASARPFEGGSIAQDEHPAVKRERELKQQAKMNREMAGDPIGASSAGSSNHQNHVQNS